MFQNDDLNKRYITCARVSPNQDNKSIEIGPFARVSFNLVEYKAPSRVKFSGLSKRINHGIENGHGKLVIGPLLSPFEEREQGFCTGIKMFKNLE